MSEPCTPRTSLFTSIARLSFPNSEMVASARAPVGPADDGDWVGYSQVDFGKGVSSVAVDLAMGPKDAKIEFHLDQPDGPLIGSLVPVSTGSWTNFQIQETPIKATSGVHDLFLTFHGEKGLPDIRSIQFKADSK